MRIARPQRELRHHTSAQASASPAPPPATATGGTAASTAPFTAASSRKASAATAASSPPPATARLRRPRERRRCRDRSLCHCDTLLLLLPVLLLLSMLLPLMLLPLMLLPLLLLSAMIIIVRHRRSSSSSTTTTINDTAAASTAASAFGLVGTSQMLAAGVSCRLRHLTLHVLASARLVLELLTYHGWIERPLCIAGDVADVARHDAHDQLGRSGQTAGQRVGWLALDARRICSCCARLLGRSPCRARWRAAVAPAAALRLEGLKIAAVAAAAGARAMKEDLVALVAARGKALLAEHACVVSLASPAHPGDIAVLEDVAARRGTVSGCHGGSFPKESNRVGVNCDRPRRHE